MENEEVAWTWNRNLHAASTIPALNGSGGPPRRETGTRIVVADDHDGLRQHVCRLLAKTPEMQIVGQAGNGQQAVALTRELMPDVVLMDVNMPHVDGIEATRRIARDYPAVKVIGISTDWTRTIVTSMFDAGAAGCISKTSLFDTLVEAIGVVSTGRRYVCVRVMSALGTHAAAL